MAEHHDHHHDLEDLDGLRPQELAAMRWQAMEAFHSAPGLSPMARRVGAALICAMDAKTRNCFPSELRIAAQLGVNLVSVKKAKAELGDEGQKLITWFNPGGPRHLCHYSFNWATLLRLSDDAKARAEKAMNERRLERRRGSQTTTIEKTPERFEELPKVAVSNGRGSHLDHRGSETATPVVATRQPELTHRTTHVDITQPEHAIASDGGKVDATLVKGEGNRSGKPPPQQAEAKGAMEGKATRKSVCYYPQLTRHFEDEPDVIETIAGLGFDQQEKASYILATKTIDAAREYILGWRP